MSASQGQTHVVPRGIVVLQATPSSFARPVPISAPDAQFFVLKDHAALFGHDITNPQQSTDQTGAADVTFGFTYLRATGHSRPSPRRSHIAAI